MAFIPGHLPQNGPGPVTPTKPVNSINRQNKKQQQQQKKRKPKEQQPASGGRKPVIDEYV